MVGATGFESETTALRFSQLAPNRPVFIHYSRPLAEATCERFIRSYERFTVRACQGLFPFTANDNASQTEQLVTKIMLGNIITGNSNTFSSSILDANFRAAQ